ITVAKYETPDHHDIHKLGIMPDETVAEPLITYAQIASEVDTQYQAALDTLTKGVTIAASPPKKGIN
ncbi:MAG: carboxyl-terminal protease, partial [Synechocystis sp.]